MHSNSVTSEQALPIKIKFTPMPSQTTCHESNSSMNMSSMRDKFSTEESKADQREFVASSMMESPIA